MAGNNYRQSNTNRFWQAFEGVDLNDPAAVDQAIENQAARTAATFARQNDLIVNRYIDDEDYGLTPDKPIFVCGRQEAHEFINSLRTKDNKLIDWQFQGPVYSDEVHGSSDMYQGITLDHKLYGTVYINFYTTLIGRPVTRIPEGYTSYLLEDDWENAANESKVESYSRTIARPQVEEPSPVLEPIREQAPPPIENPVKIQAMGTVFCRKCGTSLPADSVFCYRCGARVEEEETFASTLPRDVEQQAEQKSSREEALLAARAKAAAKRAEQELDLQEEEQPRRKTVFHRMSDALLGEDAESMKPYRNTKSEAAGPLPAWLITIVAIGAFALFVIMQIFTNGKQPSAKEETAPSVEEAAEAATEDPREMALQDTTPEKVQEETAVENQAPVTEPAQTANEETKEEPQEAASEEVPAEPDTPLTIGEPLALPGHGQIMWSVFSQPGFASPTYLAQPTERVVFQTDDANYYLRILTDDNMDGNENVMEIFLQGNHNYTIELPSANYRFKYASGKDAWYGNDALFGEETQIAATDPVSLEGAGNNSNQFTIVLGNIPHSTVTGVNGVAQFWANK